MGTAVSPPPAHRGTAGPVESVRRRSIDAILFWVALAAALGFLGRWIGFNGTARAVAMDGSVNPRIVAYGLPESFLTPISGLAILLFSALLWFLLRLGLQLRETQSR